MEKTVGGSRSGASTPIETQVLRVGGGVECTSPGMTRIAERVGVRVSTFKISAALPRRPFRHDDHARPPVQLHRLIRKIHTPPGLLNCLGPGLKSTISGFTATPSQEKTNPLSVCEIFFIRIPPTCPISVLSLFLIFINYIIKIFLKSILIEIGNRFLK